MIRKTITIQDELFHDLELNQIIEKYRSFSELVSNALELLIEKQKKEAYKRAMIEASKDEAYLKDIREIEDDFKYADEEILR